MKELIGPAAVTADDAYLDILGSGGFDDLEPTSGDLTAMLVSWRKLKETQRNECCSGGHSRVYRLRLPYRPQRS